MAIANIKAMASIDISDIARGLSTLSGQFKSFGRTADNVGRDVRDAGQDMSRAGRDINNLGDDANDTVRDLDNLGDEADEVADSMDDLGDSSDNASGGLQTLGDELGGIGDICKAISGALIAFGTLAIKSFNDIEGSATGMSAELGLTETELKSMKESMKNVGSTGVGSFEEIGKSMATVKKNMRELDGKELEDMTYKAMSLEQAMDKDVNETMRSASKLVQAFGVDGDTAMDLIVAGLQNGVDVGDDLLDTINEYSNDFSNLGFSAADTFEILDAGMKNNVRNTDVIADAWREFGIRVREGGDDISKAMKTAGVDYKKFIKEFAKGGESAKTVTEDLTRKVLSIEDPIKRNQVAVALWGTMVEDNGLEVIDVFGKVGDVYDHVSGKADKMASDNATLGATFQGMWNDIKVGLEPLGKALADLLVPAMKKVGEVAKDLGKWFSNLNPVVQDIVVAVGIGVTVFTALVPIIGLLAVTFGALSLAMSPITLTVLAIAAAIAALIAIGVVLVKNWDTIKQKAKEAWEKIKKSVSEGWDKATKVVKNAFKDFPKSWDELKVKAKETWQKIKDTASKGWDKVEAAASKLKEKVSNKFKEIGESFKEWVIDKLNSYGFDGAKIVNTVTTAFSDVKKKLDEGVAGIKKGVEDTFNSVVGVVGNAFNSVKEKVGTAWDTISKTVSSGAERIFKDVNIIFESIGGTIVGIWDSVKSNINTAWQAIKSTICGAIDNIKQTISTSWEAIKNIVSGAWAQGVNQLIAGDWEGFKQTISTALENIKTKIREAWDMVTEQVRTAFNNIGTAIGTAWDNIGTTISAKLEVAKNTISTAWQSIKDTATTSWDTIKTTVKDKWGQINTDVRNACEKVKTVVRDGWTNIKNSAKTAWEGIKNTITTAWSTVKNEVSKKSKEVETTVSNAWNTLRRISTTIWEGIKGDVINKVNALIGPVRSKAFEIANSFKSGFDRIRSFAQSIMSSAYSVISSGISRLKGLFNFSWSLPKIKLPHFSVSGKFSIDPPSIPRFSVSWYKTGGIFTGASVIGVGEKGNEAVVPLSNKTMMRPFASAVADMIDGNGSNKGGDTYNFNFTGQIVVREEADIDRISQELWRKSQREKRARGGK